MCEVEYNVHYEVINMETHSSITGSLWEEPIGHSDDSTCKGPVMRSFDVLFLC